MSHALATVRRDGRRPSARATRASREWRAGSLPHKGDLGLCEWQAGRLPHNIAIRPDYFPLRNVAVSTTFA